MDHKVQDWQVAGEGCLARVVGLDWENPRVSSMVLVDYQVHFEGRFPLAMICKKANHSQVVGVERKRDSEMTSYLGAIWVEPQPLELRLSLLHNRGHISAVRTLARNLRI